MDAASIATLAGVGVLLIDRLFDWLSRIHSSHCCGGTEIVFSDNEESKPLTSGSHN
jgi:hypothetical protein